MSAGIHMVRHAHRELDDSFLEARRVWTDATALRFAERFYKPMCELLDSFEDSAKQLMEAIEEAEWQCRD